MQQSRTSSRGVGAAAGLAPGCLIIAWYLGTGGPPQAFLLAFPIVGVAAGWIVGPRARGSIATQIIAGLTFFVVGYALQAAIDAVIIVAEDVAHGRADLPASAAERIAEVGLIRLAYLPVWALYLSPLPIVWLVLVIVLNRALSRLQHGETSTQAS